MATVNLPAMYYEWSHEKKIDVSRACMLLNGVII